MDKDTILFKNTSFSDVLKEIYTNSKRKDRTLSLLIADLRPMVKSIDDAVTLLPLISQYLTISVKNDELLVKLAAITERLLAKSDDETMGYDLSPAEMKKIEAKADELRQQNDILKKESKKVTTDDDDDDEEVI